MPCTVEIPTPMRDAAGGQASVTAAGATVAAVLADAIAQFPALGAKLFDGGKLRPYVNVFIDDEDIRYLDELETSVKDGAVVALVPAVAGG